MRTAVFLRPFLDKPSIIALNDIHYHENLYSKVRRRSVGLKTKQWEKVASRARAILNYGMVQKEWLEKSRMAQFIAAVPFLAGCDKALETSFTNLLIYLVSLDESARDIFLHKPEDDADIYSRLRPLLSFSGGDPAVLQCCKDLLALCMISNYKKDAEEDEAKGKYNPFIEGSWNETELIKELTEKIDKSITPEISEFYTIQEALRGLWQD
jgi:hypothetical protein